MCTQALRDFLQREMLLQTASNAVEVDAIAVQNAEEHSPDKFVNWTRELIGEALTKLPEFDLNGPSESRE
jgi:hypothetical protein